MYFASRSSLVSCVFAFLSFWPRSLPLSPASEAVFEGFSEFNPVLVPDFVFVFSPLRIIFRAGATGGGVELAVEEMAKPESGGGLHHVSLVNNHTPQKKRRVVYESASHVSRT